MNNIKVENICIGRILGNYNPPKSSAQSRLEELEDIIKIEANIHADKIWVLNRIFDQDYNSKIKNILIKNNYQFYEIPFIYDDFASSKDQFSYLANINSARNFLIKKCLTNYKYVFCLDGDCLFNSQSFSEVTAKLDSDPSKPYYAVMAKRIIKKEFKYDFSNMIDGEPMLVFTKNSKTLFDENTPFGANDKNELCWKLGFSKKLFKYKIYDSNIFGNNDINFADYVDMYDDLKKQWNDRANNHYLSQFSKKSDFGYHHYLNAGIREKRKLPEPREQAGNLCAVLGNVFHISCADQKLETDSKLRKKARISSLNQTVKAVKEIYEKSSDYRVYT